MFGPVAETETVGAFLDILDTGPFISETFSVGAATEADKSGALVEMHRLGLVEEVVMPGEDTDTFMVGAVTEAFMLGVPARFTERNGNLAEVLSLHPAPPI